MLALLGVACTMPLTGTSRVRGLAAGALGLALATVGLDPITGTPRFTLGQIVLWDGIGLIPVALGLFAIPEIVSLASRPSIAPAAAPGAASFVDGARAAAVRWRTVLRSSAVGTAIGLLPGVGASASQWIAYADASRRSAGPAFGTGAVEGVIAPSAANNATLGGALVPMLALGIPGSLGAAMLLSALIMKGFVPGASMLMPERDGGHLAFVYSIVWMLVLANALAAVLTWLTTRWLVRITTMRSALLVPILLVLVCLGAFAERHLVADLAITAALGIVGLVFAHFSWPRAPFLIGFVLGTLVENRLFLSLQAYGLAWLTRPGVVAIGVLIATTLILPARSAAGAGSTPRAPRKGERVVISVLLAISVAGLVATFLLPHGAAVFPRLVLFAAAALLLGLLASELRLSRSSAAMPVGLEGASVRTAASVFAFVLLIWALGFTWGATLAVFAHLVVIERERPAAVALTTIVAYLLLDLVMGRLLQVPFPDGAVLEAARTFTR
jgi:TctA family transporter